MSIPYKWQPFKFSLWGWIWSWNFLYLFQVLSTSLARNWNENRKLQHLLQKPWNKPNKKYDLLYKALVEYVECSGVEFGVYGEVNPAIYHIHVGWYHLQHKQRHYHSLLHIRFCPNHHSINSQPINMTCKLTELQNRLNLHCFFQNILSEYVAQWLRIFGLTIDFTVNPYKIH